MIQADWIDLNELRQLPRNSKLHDTGELGESFGEFGFVDRIIINRTTGNMIAGHGRVDALNEWRKKNKTPPDNIQIADGKWLAPVDFIECEAGKEDALAIRLNLSQAKGGRLDLEGMLATFDLEKLYETAADLQVKGNLGASGIGQELFGYLYEQVNGEEEAPDDPGAQVDRAEELREQWGVELGQLWRIPSKTGKGEHRIICGDCTDKSVVERVMGGEKAGIMVTDPPYGVEYSPEWRDEADKKGILGNRYAIRSKGKVANDNVGNWGNAYSLFDGDVAYVWSGDRNLQLVLNDITECQFIIVNVIIWGKPHFALSQGDYHSQHESCVYAVRSGKNHSWSGDRTQSTLWEIAGMNPMGRSSDASDERTGHSTQKPIECMERPIRNHKLGIVYDPFLGSGTTLIACERLGRLGRGVEISPGYVAVSLQRLADMGLEPVLAEGEC